MHLGERRKILKLCYDSQHLVDDALEQLIKSKQEAEIFNDLPLFDVEVLNNFIDEWFDTRTRKTTRGVRRRRWERRIAKRTTGKMLGCMR